MLYGLGTENANLPGFITHQPAAEQRRPGELRQLVPAGRSTRDTQIGRGGFGPVAEAQQVSNLKNPQPDDGAQRVQLDFVQSSTANALERGGRTRRSRG